MDKPVGGDFTASQGRPYRTRYVEYDAVSVLESGRVTRGVPAPKE